MSGPPENRPGDRTRWTRKRELARGMRLAMTMAMRQPSFIVLAMVLFTACGSGRPASRCDAIGPDELTALARGHGMSRAGILIPAREARAQARRHGSDICLGHALRVALHAVLHDRSDSESPASMLAYYGHQYVRHRDTTFRLAPRGTRAPRGESPREAWIFVLSMPALSDHVYWIVVARQRDPAGHVVVHAYGVN